MLAATSAAPSSAESIVQLSAGGGSKLLLTGGSTTGGGSTSAGSNSSGTNQSKGDKATKLKETLLAQMPSVSSECIAHMFYVPKSSLAEAMTTVVYASAKQGLDHLEKRVPLITAMLNKTSDAAQKKLIEMNLAKMVRSIGSKFIAANFLEKIMQLAPQHWNKYRSIIGTWGDTLKEGIEERINQANAHLQNKTLGN